MNAIAVYIPCPDRKTAVRISRKLLEERLIACANIFPIRSMYWWKGRIQECSETVIFCKTKNCLYSRIVRELRRLHPYEVPLAGRFGIHANEEYLKWLRKETRKS
jgi:periplasmic divalent cation tolerance protein